jgi:DUF971 family protein
MPSNDPLHLAVSKSNGIKIDWSDGHHSEYSCAYLRDECPCASCTGAHGAEPMKSDYANPFQMYKAKLKMQAIEELGHYAVRIDWNDGHNAGIYSYDLLRRICPCPECRQGHSSRR